MASREKSIVTVKKEDYIELIDEVDGSDISKFNKGLLITILRYIEYQRSLSEVYFRYNTLNESFFWDIPLDHVEKKNKYRGKRR